RFGTFASLTVVRSLRSLWHAHCVRFGTLTAFAFVRASPFGTFASLAVVGCPFQPKRPQGACKRPKAVPKGAKRPYQSEACKKPSRRHDERERHGLGAHDAFDADV